MSSETGKLQSRLQVLQRQYSQELPGKIEQLEKSWQRFTEQGDRRALDSLVHDAHNLTGSGAIYGYHQTSTIARELEQLLAEIQKSQQQPDPAHQRRIEHCIEALRLAAQSPVQDATPP